VDDAPAVDVFERAHEVPHVGLDVLGVHVLVEMLACQIVCGMMMAFEAHSKVIALVIRQDDDDLVLFPKGRDQAGYAARSSGR
jgi:hypothetical protein